MKRLVLATAAVIVAASLPVMANSECTLFSIDAACSTSKKPELRVSFSGPSPRPPVPVAKAKPARREAAVLLPHVPEVPAIDCGLVREPASGANLGARVITPHPGVTSSMRIVAVPACRK